jgi:hypothetical protein
MISSAPGRALLLGLLAAALAGCSLGPAAEGPRSVAESFGTAWAQKDGPALCKLLAPDTRAEVAQSAKQPCARGILDEDLPDGGSVRSTKVWGRAAQVSLTGDTLFLSRFQDGWKVLAAGCKPQSGKPYDCQVQGG